MLREKRGHFFCPPLIVLLISIVSIIFVHGISFAEAADSAPVVFLEANQAYEKGDFAHAASLYEQLINSGFHSGTLYYNLGNSYTKLGETGKALLNYRKAEQLMPRDGDLKFNLNYILDQRKDKIETKERADLIRVFFFWYYWLNIKELFYIFLLANLLFWALSLILLYKPVEGLKLTRVIIFSLLLVFGASFGIKTYTCKAIRHGVIVSPEVTVRSGNGTGHSPLFIMHEGAEFRITGQTKGWMKIYLTEGKIGWIPSYAAGII